MIVSKDSPPRTASEGHPFTARMPSRRGMRARGNVGRRRRGAVTVEFALVVPLVFTLFFAAYEFSRVNMVRHTMDIAAYEGAREGILPGATSAGVKSRVRTVLNSTGVANASIRANVGADQVTVTITVPLSGNLWMGHYFTSNDILQKSYALRREGT